METNDLPLDDTINSVFSSIDPKQFEICFTNWASSLPDSFKNQVIAIGGKTVRGAKSKDGKSRVRSIFWG